MPTQAENEAEVSKMLYKHRMLANPSEEELEKTIDQTTGFAMPVVKMGHFARDVKGLQDWNSKWIRPRLRRVVSATNQFPDQGPQDMVTRLDAIRHYVGLPSRAEERVANLRADWEAGLVSDEKFLAAQRLVDKGREWVYNAVRQAQAVSRGTELKIKK